MAKLTRLASTVTARYFPTSDLTDAFYLDGRLSGKREARAADITVDKEDRGFFFCVFSHSTTPGRDPSAEQVFEAPLRKLSNEIKSGRKALDDEIGELVNTAVAVTGRMKLQSDNSRAPFFAGVLVKDSEAFAITMGKGLAFLYRDDTLFPLTATDLQIEPVNTQRQKVDNFYNYCATKTATALCSNIAQLKMDDCIILCNREVYDALGQQEILRILYDAEDQCDAAGIVITEAAAKLSGVPLQFMISFVETVTSQEKTGLFGFGKKNRQQSYNEVDDDAIEVPIAKAGSLAGGAAAAQVSAQVSAPVSAPAEAEPLFFGNDATNPFVQPLAEQPVSPTGPQDPIHFKDDSLEPFGEPVKEDKPVLDESGFVKTEFADDTDHFAANTNQANSAYQPEDMSQNSPAAPQYIPEMPEEAEEGEPLVFGDAAPSVTKSVQPEYSQSNSQEYPKPNYSDTQGYSNSQPAAPDHSSSSTYYIPFESKEPGAPSTTNVNDIPDMPLYEAPTYLPPTYPANSYSPRGYDNTGVYARGSYSLEDEDADMRKDLPPQQSPSNRSYSYTPPQQTVSSYGAAKDMRPGHMQQMPPRPSSQPMQQAGQPRTNQQSHRPSQDMFEQEKGFDYGDTNSAYKRNRLMVAILVGLCVLCVIILAYAFAISSKKATPASVPTTKDSAVITTTESTKASGGATPTPGETTKDTNPTGGDTVVKPIGVFIFSDKTGYRTWWDLFNTSYSINIPSEADPRVKKIIQYNSLAADYTPKVGDKIKIPPLALFTTPTATPTPKVT